MAGSTVLGDNPQLGFFERVTLFGIPVHRKIRTGQRQVAWSAVALLCMVWFTWGFNLFAGGQALTFTIQKYAADPRMISIVMTASGLLMLAPVLSYMSDQIWTRMGRRRPFVILAWIGGFFGMASFAFFPQISAAMNDALQVVGIPPVSEVLLLAMIVAIYKKLWDFTAPLEPLFLECVPPHQRGRFWAMRGMVFTCAVMIFYQVMWPNYDVAVDQLAWLGFPEVLVLTGEQAIYILCAILFLVTGLFVVFCVEEVMMPSAPNQRIRTLLFGRRVTEPTTPAAAPPQVDFCPRCGYSLAGLPPGAECANCWRNRLDRRATATGFWGWLTRSRPVNTSAQLLHKATTGKKQAELRAKLTRVPIVNFVVNFARDVFLRVECYPFYIVLVIPAIEASVWGNFNPLMQNDQFEYSKEAQARWALPIGLLSAFVLQPLAGWYSDVRLTWKWWLRILLLICSAGSFAAMLWMVKTYSPEDIRAIPSFSILLSVTLLAAFSMVCLYVPMVETMLDVVGREHARAWVSLLTVIKSMINIGLLYFWIASSPGQVLPIMVWMVFSVVAATLGILMDTFIGPMIYDYMPRSQMGTINAGKGIYEGFIQFGAANLGAWWIVFFSTYIHKPDHVEYDYSSMYILQFLLFIPALWAKIYFIQLIAKGKMLKWGAMEMEGTPEQKQVAAKHEEAVTANA